MQNFDDKEVSILERVDEEYRTFRRLTDPKGKPYLVNECCFWKNCGGHIYDVLCEERGLSSSVWRETERISQEIVDAAQQGKTMFRTTFRYTPVNSRNQVGDIQEIDCTCIINTSLDKSADASSYVRFGDYGISCIIFVQIPSEKMENLTLYDIYSSVQHELNHIYQQLCMGDEYKAKANYQYATDFMQYKNNVYSCIGTIGYLFSGGEKDSFGNEVARMIYEWFVNFVPYDFEKTPAVRWLKRLKLCISYIQVLKRNGLIDNEKESYEEACKKVFGKILSLYALEGIAIRAYYALERCVTRGIESGLWKATIDGKARLHAIEGDRIALKLDEIMEKCTYDESKSFIDNLLANVHD